MGIISLSEMRPGESCTIQSLPQYGFHSRRLQELGFHPGNCVRCAYVAPSGTPIAFWSLGALIALRADDCSEIRGVTCV